MPILYSAIAQKNEIFAEYPEKEHPKLAEVCAKIIAQIPVNENCKKTFEESNHGCVFFILISLGSFSRLTIFF